MTDYLGYRQEFGVIGADGMNPYGTGFWEVAFGPAEFAVATNRFEIYHMALKGPAGSSVQVYADRVFYDITQHGDVNSWDPNEALNLDGGKTLYLYWNTAALPIPQVTVWMRSPAILR